MDGVKGDSAYSGVLAPAGCNAKTIALVLKRENDVFVLYVFQDGAPRKFGLGLKRV